MFSIFVMFNDINEYKYSIDFFMKIDDIVMKSFALTINLKSQNHINLRNDFITENKLNAKFIRKRRHFTFFTIQVFVSKKNIIIAKLR